MTHSGRRTNRARAGLAGLVAALTAGCAAISNNPRPLDASGNPVGTVIADKSVQISRGFGVGVEYLALGSALYWLVDPLAPNWQLQQGALGTERVRIALRKKRFASGGDGEAAQLFARHAEQLARAGGFAGYTVLEYSEGIDSALPLAQRVAQGVIRLDR